LPPGVRDLDRQPLDLLLTTSWETGRAMRSDTEKSERNRWRLVLVGTALCFIAAGILAFVDVTPWARVPPLLAGIGGLIAFARHRKRG
jgi:hypothetical protein